MGNVFGGPTVENSLTPNVNVNGDSEMGDPRDDDNEDFYDTVEDYQDARNRRKEEQLNEFKKQLDIKREQRRNILDRHRAEKKNLEEDLNEERKSKLELLKQNKILQDLLQANNIEIPESCRASTEYEDFLKIIEKMNEDVEVLKTNNNRLRSDLANSNKALQEANSDIASLSAQNTESIKQINALKEVIAVTKTMMNLRENQLLELKNKLNEIEQSLADREASMLSTDLRQEYERQLNNIRTLRGLYEERARLAEVTKQALVRDLEQQKGLLQAEVSKNEDLNNKVQELENKVDVLEDTVNDKNSSIATFKEECRGLQSEMTVVNKLFSQVLLGYKSKKDLDKLVTRLEENHGILTHMVEQENGSEGSSALPKMLLELVGQIEDNDVGYTEKCQDTDANDDEGNASTEKEATVGKAEEIVQNLPKVWRVLMELLSHQSEAETNSSERVTTCYKPVQTKSGTVLVPSVSQTYIRLKDLILEKLALIKEVNRMKQLNTHLESRLQEQEKRLCSVTNELSKTWHVVGRLRRHHQQLHTHEKILKYELQQKRKLLNELKEELEYCREKWEQAREKNTQSEKDWKKLRMEFSNRKLDSMSFNNSAESGYSDERPSDESSESNDESEYIKEPKLKFKKKLKKSFETVIDSSTDINLVAERDDPVSDMLDVADISLDTQEDNMDTFDHSDSCTSENVQRNERVVETEDECPDISHDLSSHETDLQEQCDDSDCSVIPVCSNEISESCGSSKTSQDNHAVIGSTNGDLSVNEPKTSNSSTSEVAVAGSSRIEKPILAPTVEVDFKAILESVKQQDKRLRLKDERLENLEYSASVVVSDLTSTLEAEECMLTRLDELNALHNKERSDTECSKEETLYQTLKGEEEVDVPDKNIAKSEPSTSNETLQINTSKPSTSKTEAESVSDKAIVEVDFKAILGNVRRQEEKLREKDKRLHTLEEGCSNVVSNLTTTLHTGDTMISKLDTLKSERKQETVEDWSSNLENTGLEKEDETINDVVDVENEPSTSSEIDHEARFAARDIRLKRLEEQTKSLVNRVNKTATKGVKIHYKLEELQNIYSSDNSRSGTPSDDTEDISQKTDDGSQEE
ncbi:putative leucine-rich repeat-containing protein DDB_G0290503 [Aricia agestis]|uniref:putative leucine-rich repeat-containing protein DDB_G0290503 n=1 Tax=Aricia agestis TaxID=91739 RepID=UPI001C2055AE|nr:putative leucine-rich repeat-containing protein DDB_G0290503 [Aricia agestis]